MRKTSCLEFLHEHAGLKIEILRFTCCQDLEIHMNSLTCRGLSLFPYVAFSALLLIIMITAVFE